MENSNKSSVLFYAIKYIFLILLVCITPLTISKILIFFRGSNSNGSLNTLSTINQNQIKDQLDEYIKNNSKFILENIIQEYYKQQNISSNEKIENAIWLMEKEIFDENLPQVIIKNKINDNLPKILVLFSDFDLVKSMFEDINENKLNINAHLYFRQIVTQSKYSAIIASYAYAIFKLYPQMFLKFYIEICSVERGEISYEKIKEILLKYQLDYKKIEDLASNIATQELIKNSNTLAYKLNIDQLPAFILQNGQIFFGLLGFNVLQNLK